MRIADIDEVLHDRTPIVFALDQRPFEHEKHGTLNTFGVLVPLMTEDGRRFEDLERTFDNRGRVWWLMSQDHERIETDAGAIWSGPIEAAPQYDANSSDRDKDRFQAVRRAIQPGAKDWFDLIDVGFDPRDVVTLLARTGHPVARPPTRIAFVRGAGQVVGPLHAEWLAKGRSVRLSAANVGKPQAWAAEASALATGENLEEFTYRANRWQRSEPERGVTVRLVHRRLNEHLQKHGQLVDVASSEQVVKWALELAKHSKAERNVFRDALNRLPSESLDSEAPGRMARFRALCGDADEVLTLGAEAAEAVAAQPAFEKLLSSRADALVAERIADEVNRRTAEIERRVAEEQGRLERLRAQVEELTSSYDTQRSDQERRLAAEHGEWLRALEAREAATAEREQGIAERERTMEQRIESAIRAYETRSREIADRLLIDFPVLQRLAGVRAEGTALGADAQSRATLTPHQGKPRERGGLGEEQFLAQLRDVAARRQYAFADEDLVAFHVAVKSGFWTVLAGPSGTGKTSLPRIYAEALGVLDEYLLVPVRPDWLDDRDVLGAYNALAGRFEPAATGLVDRLVQAADDLARQRGGIYLVCLDEMNLARVEHYLAQVLSVAEEPPARRRLHLYSAGLERPGEPYAPWRELPLGENVRILGTVNVDETTHFFSPKVLDRAPVLTFAPPDLGRAHAPRAQAQTLPITPVHYEEWRAWIRGADQAEPAAKDLALQVDRALKGARAGLGFRLFQRVLASTASAQGLLPADRAMDHALAQGVLPRLRTNQAGMDDALRALAELLPEKRFPRCARVLHALREGGGEHDFFHVV
jgi:hypothetical protein